MPQLLKTKEEALQACAEQHREFAGRAALPWNVHKRMTRQRSRLGLLAATCLTAAAACRLPPPAAASPRSCYIPQPTLVYRSADALVTCFKTCSFASSFKGCCTQEHKVFWECYTRERVRRTGGVVGLTGHLPL